MNRASTLHAKCCVPTCRNTTTNSRNTIFVVVREIMKREWCKILNVDYKAGRRMLCCEDHLNLEQDLENYQYLKLMKGRPSLKSSARPRLQHSSVNQDTRIEQLPKDMENYVEYTTMGIVSRIRMRPGCLPTKFACQPNRANISTDVCRPAAAKRQRLSLIRECEEEIRAAQRAQAQPIENLKIEVVNQDEDPVQEQLQNTTKFDKAVQICIRAKYRSKTTQTETKSSMKKTSPIKSQNNSHYMIPIEELNQPEMQEQIQLHEDLINNQNDVINKQQMPLKIEQQFQSFERPFRKYVDIPDSVPPPRALLTLPSALRMRRGTVVTDKLLPPGVRFGPVQGVVREISSEYARTMISKAATSETPLFLILNDDSISQIDVSDKEKSNWFSLLPLGTARSANLWLHQQDGGVFAVTSRPVRARTPLYLGYSRSYAELLGLPEGMPVQEADGEEDQQKWWCHECRLVFTSESLLKRHDKENHTGSKTKTRRRRYRCKHCALPFSRLFTLKRHMSIHCKGKTSKPEPQPETEKAQPVQEPFLNTEDDRVPSDESFQNYTNSLDFSTSLFDTDRLSALDISVNSRQDLNFYSEKDDSLLPAPDPMEHFVERKPVEAISIKTESEVTSTNVTTCPHCQENVEITSKRQHMRECVSRSHRCSCGAAFSSRARLDRHVYTDHGRNKNSPKDETDSSTNPFKCYECNLNFKRRGMYVNHMWRSHGSQALTPLRREQRRYPCVACPKLYHSHAKRAAHVKIHHPGAELVRAQTISLGIVSLSPAACPHCPRQYATRAKMLQHVRASHPELTAESPSKSHK